MQSLAGGTLILNNYLNVLFKIDENSEIDLDEEEGDELDDMEGSDNEDDKSSDFEDNDVHTIIIIFFLSHLQ